MTGPSIAWYDRAGGREAMLRFGPASGPVVIAALPLFEEANRTRTFLVTILRALAARGVAGVLPDLPGMGESPVAVRDTTLDAMRAAFAAAATSVGAVCALTIRSGALVDTGTTLRARWQLAPQDGDGVRRGLERLRALGSRHAADGAMVEIGGNLLSIAMLDSLAGASTILRDVPCRIVRLEGDPRAADRHLAGPRLWRRAEPGNDAALAERLADDVAAWVDGCAR